MGRRKRNQHIKEEKIYKYNYIYEIKILSGNSIGHYYIGQHSTDDLNDGYLGSGHIFWDWYHSKERIFGVDFTKRIICFCDTLEELNDCEWYYIYDKYNTDKMCWNLRAGGDKPGVSYEVVEKQKASNKLWCINHPDACSERSHRAGKTRYSKQEERDKTGQKSHESWENYTEEEYKARCNIMQDMWDSKTDEQRKAHSEHTREGNIRYWNNVTDEYKLEFGEKISNSEYGSWHMTSINDEQIYFVIPSKQQDFIDRGYYRCMGSKNREPWHEKVIKNDKLSKGNKGSILMTKPGDKVRYVTPDNQPEFIANGYYRCHMNGTPW